MSLSLSGTANRGGRKPIQTATPLNPLMDTTALQQMPFNQMPRRLHRHSSQVCLLPEATARRATLDELAAMLRDTSTPPRTRAITTGSLGFALSSLSPCHISFSGYNRACHNACTYILHLASRIQKKQAREYSYSLCNEGVPRHALTMIRTSASQGPVLSRNGDAEVGGDAGNTGVSRNYRYRLARQDARYNTPPSHGGPYQVSAMLTKGVMGSFIDPR
jgi:hypothetical protein